MGLSQALALATARGLSPETCTSIRTSVIDELFDSQETVRAYKSLSRVERAFRSYKKENWLSRIYGDQRELCF